jgi:hypothetical protein
MIKNHIDMYMHCPRCLDDRPDDVTPSDWARLNVGVTETGVQIWCVRHECHGARFSWPEGRRSLRQGSAKAKVVFATPASRQRKLTSRRPKY